MLAEVKKCADSNDIKGLHYIFVDCLDVDPTFEKYAEDFEYCKNINGFLVTHTNLTPIRNRIGWDRAYWEQLKLDLMKNFSEERFSHMREVAEYIYADKIKRLKEERAKSSVSTKSAVTPQKNVRSEPVKQESTPGSSVSIEKEKVPNASRRETEWYNQPIEQQIEREKQEQQAQPERNEASRQQANATGPNNTENRQSSKKSLGVALLLTAAAIIVIVVLIKVL